MLVGNLLAKCHSAATSGTTSLSEGQVTLIDRIGSARPEGVASSDPGQVNLR